MYESLWKLLTPEAREGVLEKNYERIFNEGRKNARALGEGASGRDGRMTGTWTLERKAGSE